MLFLKDIKRLALASFLIVSLTPYSQSASNKVYVLTKDSIPNYLREPWKYFAGDSLTMSRFDYNDREWQTIRPDLKYYKIPTGSFKGIGWFRFHFRVDSSLVNKPLAISVRHYGASEIYLDGRLLTKYGVIKDSANCLYFDPQELPVIFIIPDSGNHVFSIRYANYNAKKNYSFYKNSFAGFELILASSNDLIQKRDYRSLIVTFVFILLMGIFLILSLLHLFLYLYYPIARSNLFFSIFMLCLASLSLIGYFTLLSENPSLQIRSIYMINFILCLSCVSLSVFINELFSKKYRIRFWIILGLAVISGIFKLLGFGVYSLITIGLIISVCFEAAFIIIFALVRKVKGTRIIGIGILFCSLFFITIFFLTIFSGGQFDINDSTPEGQLLLLIAALSVISVPLSMSAYLAWSFATMNKSLVAQVEQIKLLSEKNLEQEQEKVKLISEQNEMLEQKVEERTAELKLEKKKSDDLLLNILPSEIAEELKQKGKSDAHLYDQVSVLFTDFVSFTTISEKLSPKELVDEINHYFTAFDDIMERNGLEKIKTIGDAYMAVCGMPNNDKDHAIKTVNAALEILHFIRNRMKEGGIFDIRIGINSGPVVAGIVGVKKFAYDIWGDTVNTAARMEQNSEPGKINISGSTYELVKDSFACTHRGKINAKNKGDIDMYYVEGQNGN